MIDLLCVSDYSHFERIFHKIHKSCSKLFLDLVSIRIHSFSFKRGIGNTYIGLASFLDFLKAWLKEDSNIDNLHVLNNFYFILKRVLSLKNRCWIIKKEIKSLDKIYVTIIFCFVVFTCFYSEFFTMKGFLENNFIVLQRIV